MFNIRDVLDQYNVRCADSSHHHVGSKWVGVDCPYCTPGSGKFRLGFDIRSGGANCWQCGRIAASTALSIVCGISKGEAIEILKKNTRRKFKRPDHLGVLKNPEGIGKLKKPHKSYLNKRGLSWKAIQDIWEVSGIGMHRSLSWRLFIPIFDKWGEQVSWTTRKINDQKDGLRYQSASSEQEAVPHKTLLYGGHLTRHIVVVNEGPIDAWTIGVGAVATCGTGFTSEQIAEISNYPYRVVCFDSSRDAQKRADRLCRALAVCPGVTKNVYLETGDDANAADPEEIEELRNRFIYEGRY